jgi:hypothetical protein
MRPTRKRSVRGSAFTAVMAGALTLGCSNEEKVIEATAKTFETAGGPTQSADGRLTVSFDVGAFKRPTTVLVKTLQNVAPVDGLSLAYEISALEGAIPPGRLAIAIDENKLAKEEDAVVALITDTGSEGEIDDSSFDDAANRVFATMPYAGVYAAVRRPNTCLNQPCGVPCNPGSHVPKACDPNHRCVPISASFACGHSGGLPFDDGGGGGAFDDGGFDIDAGIIPIADGGPFPEGDGSFFSDAECSPQDGGSDLTDGGVSIRDRTFEQEPNNLMIPQPICLGFYQTLTIIGKLDGGDDDVFQFDVPTGFFADFEGSLSDDSTLICNGGAVASWTIELLDGHLSPLANSNDNHFVPCPDVSFAVSTGARAMPPGSYFVRITRPNPADPAQAYFATFQLYPANARDGGIIPPPGDGGVFVGDGGASGG